MFICLFSAQQSTVHSPSKLQGSVEVETMECSIRLIHIQFSSSVNVDTSNENETVQSTAAETNDSAEWSSN